MDIRATGAASIDCFNIPFSATRQAHDTDEEPRPSYAVLVPDPAACLPSILLPSFFPSFFIPSSFLSLQPYLLVFLRQL